MHHHVWCAIQQVVVPIEHIVHVGNMGVIVPIIESA
jgi:hypothetical protein